MSGDKAIITLALGKPKYVEMAKTLARSLILHSPNIPRRSSPIALTILNYLFFSITSTRHIRV